MLPCVPSNLDPHSHASLECHFVAVILNHNLVQVADDQVVYESVCYMERIPDLTTFAFHLLSLSLFMD